MGIRHAHHRRDLRGTSWHSPGTIWQDSPSTSTPITAAQLQRMEDGIRAGLPFFDVRDYGAALDDTTNDAARLQALLDAAAAPVVARCWCRALLPRVDHRHAAGQHP